ncbi:hypothetical protein ABIB57_000916 [Devosia sp. UYZn731]|uniref:hypothetical protein n=1 Tax=Devosia sp. UYZn731 TaxID=3156345 RepID=UPI0033957758
MDIKAAQKLLGDDLARIFHSLVSDMRGAMYLSEMPEGPELSEQDGVLKFSFPLQGQAVLDVWPLATSGLTVDNWGGTHRVKLIRIRNNGAVLI